MYNFIVNLRISMISIQDEELARKLQEEHQGAMTVKIF